MAAPVSISQRSGRTGVAGRGDLFVAGGQGQDQQGGGRERGFHGDDQCITVAMAVAKAAAGAMMQ
ncbi:MAG: hypothetical protein HC807_08050 [Gammaproteobacteria bacterium]|nr:hypothetical protein [Gammaproteobacteria bacterium]